MIQYYCSECGILAQVFDESIYKGQVFLNKRTNPLVGICNSCLQILDRDSWYTEYVRSVWREHKYENESPLSVISGGAKSFSEETYDEEGGAVEFGDLVSNQDWQTHLAAQRNTIDARIRARVLHDGWGAKRIHKELITCGMKISQRKVSYMVAMIKQEDAENKADIAARHAKGAMGFKWAAVERIKYLRKIQETAHPRLYNRLEHQIELLEARMLKELKVWR